MTGGWRKLDNVKFADLYSSPNIIRLPQSRRMRRVGNIPHKGNKKKAYSRT